MPPQVALVLTLLFIAYLFSKDRRQQYSPSGALWIPCVWMLIHGSRSVTEWVNLGGPIIAGGNLEEGSPLDRTVFFSLIVAGLVVLIKRGVSWSELFRNNIALILFFSYCGISILWSDFPFVAMKRWFKGLGDPIMVLIILTDRDPLKAVEIVFRTCANVLLPISVLFIKYYPNLGRTYSEWTGAAGYTGVTTNKNLLGFVLMVCGLSLVWRLSSRWGGHGSSGKWIDDKGIPILLLCMVGWLFQMSDSKTSLISFLLGLLVFIVLGLRNVREHTGSYIVAGLLAFSVLQLSMDVTASLMSGASRDATLTGRTELWAKLLGMDGNPWIGSGFESFWLGDRLKQLWAEYYFRPNQAHNGYIEIYLNLGWIGLLLLGGLIVSAYRKIRKMVTVGPRLSESVNFSKFCMAYLVAYVVYNYTEAAFKSLHFLFLIFLLVAIKYREPQSKMIQSYPASFSGKASNVGSEALRFR